MVQSATSVFLENCRRALSDLWESLDEIIVPIAGIPESVAEAIDRSVNARMLTYRYVLPTQLLAKTVNQDLDCRVIQASARVKGAFDARSVCHSVIVPFDRVHHGVLGGSKEPYLNNPLRIPIIGKRHRAAQKDKR